MTYVGKTKSALEIRHSTCIGDSTIAGHFVDANHSGVTLRYVGIASLPSAKENSIDLSLTSLGQNEEFFKMKMVGVPWWLSG